MSYAGDVSLEQAWQKVASGAVLVDVRTEPEWRLIGVPDLQELDAVPRFISWNFPGGALNPGFLDEFRHEVPVDTDVVLLCRSGNRSAAAAEALSSLGYTCYNVSEGFEGITDAYGDRTINGWKNRGLPWHKPDPESQNPGTGQGSE